MGFMVRDAAFAAPHHEGLAAFSALILRSGLWAAKVESTRVSQASGAETSARIFYPGGMTARRA
jgi:hypothetical protein